MPRSRSSTARTLSSENNYLLDSATLGIGMSASAGTTGHRLVGNVIRRWNLTGIESTVNTSAIAVFGFGRTPDSGRVDVLNNTIHSSQVSERLIGITLGNPSSSDSLRGARVLNNTISMPANTNPEKLRHADGPRPPVLRRRDRPRQRLPPAHRKGLLLVRPVHPAGVLDGGRSRGEPRPLHRRARVRATSGLRVERPEFRSPVRVRRAGARRRLRPGPDARLPH